MIHKRMDDRLRRVVREIILEALCENTVAPEYAADLDAVEASLQASLKALEAAHQKAPDPISKTIITGVHSDIFNAIAGARGFSRKLKSGRPQG